MWIKHWSYTVTMPPTQRSGAQLAETAKKLLDQGRVAEALQHTNASLECGYETAELQNLRGILLNRQTSLHEAIAAYQRAVTLRLDWVIPLCNLGITLKRAGRIDLAAGCWRDCIRIAPSFTDAYVALALVTMDRGEVFEAENILQQALALDPESKDALVNLGMVLHCQDRIKEAIVCYKRAIALDPSVPAAYVNLGTALHQQRMSDDARASFEKALSIDPNLAAAQYNLAQELLLLGELERGWALYESRFEYWRQHSVDLPLLAKPSWRSERLAGQTILLTAEQGLGDTLQFIRYAPLVARLGARVVVQCQHHGAS